MMRTGRAGVRFCAVGALLAFLIPVSLSAAQGGAAPKLKVTPQELSFPSHFYGSAGATRFVTITNEGDGPLKFAKPLASVSPKAWPYGDFGLADQSSFCPFVLEPGHSCTVGVTFVPSEIGALEATLNINDDAAGSPQQVSLKGTGVDSLDRARLIVLLRVGVPHFGAQRLDVEGRKLVYLRNVGDKEITVSDITLGGADPGQFKLDASRCKETLPAQSGNASQCDFWVFFKPDRLGWSSTILTVTDTAGDSPQEFAFSGVGAPTPKAKLVPAKLVFRQKIDTTSEPKTVSVENVGTAPLLISAVRLAYGAGLFTVVANHCKDDTTLEPGKACAFGVTYLAHGASDQGKVGNAGEVVVFDNTLPGKMHKLQLRGFVVRS